MRKRDARAGFEQDVRVEEGRVRPDHCTQAESVPAEQAQPDPAVAIDRQIVVVVVAKAGSASSSRSAAQPQD